MEERKEVELPEFDPESLGFKEDIYSAYSTFRQFAPVYYREKYDDWIITRYDDVKQCMENPLLRSVTMEKPFTVVNLQLDDLLKLNSEQKIFILQNKIQDIHNHFLGNLSPPYHTHIRQIIAPLFSSSRIESLRSKIQNISDLLITAKIKNGEMDIVNDYAFPLVTEVIFTIFGLPLCDIEKIN